MKIDMSTGEKLWLFFQLGICLLGIACLLGILTVAVWNLIQHLRWRWRRGRYVVQTTLSTKDGTLVPAWDAEVKDPPTSDPILIDPGGPRICAQCLHYAGLLYCNHPEHRVPPVKGAEFVNPAMAKPLHGLCTDHNRKGRCAKWEAKHPPLRLVENEEPSSEENEEPSSEESEGEK